MATQAANVATTTNSSIGPSLPGPERYIPPAKAMKCGPFSPILDYQSVPGLATERAGMCPGRARIWSTCAHGSTHAGAAAIGGPYGRREALRGSGRSRMRNAQGLRHDARAVPSSTGLRRLRWGRRIALSSAPRDTLILVSDLAGAGGRDVARQQADRCRAPPHRA